MCPTLLCIHADCRAYIYLHPHMLMQVSIYSMKSHFLLQADWVAAGTVRTHWAALAKSLRLTGERSGKVFSLWTKAARVQQQHKQPKSLRTFVLAWCSSEPKNLLLGKQLNLSQGGKKGEKNLLLGKKFKVGPVTNCPQPPALAVSGLSLENFFSCISYLSLGLRHYLV